MVVVVVMRVCVCGGGGCGGQRAVKVRASLSPIAALDVQSCTAVVRGLCAAVAVMMAAIFRQIGTLSLILTTSHLNGMRLSGCATCGSRFWNGWKISIILILFTL